MNSQRAPFTDPMRGTLWSPERIERELMALRNLKFFKYSGHSLVASLPHIIGTISVKQPETGRVQSLSIRIEYPRPYPRAMPRVIDHEKHFAPSANGHQFNDYSLCLSFPKREEFTFGSEELSQQVLGASLIWLDKRNIFERGEPWPGEVEEHGWSAPLRELLREEVRRSQNRWISAWTDWILAELIIPNYAEKCPCLSGKMFARCHFRLLNLAFEYLLYSMQERELHERRTTVKAA